MTLLGILMLLAFITPVVNAFTEPVKSEVSCQPPSPYVSSQGTGSVTYSWSAVSGATNYKVWYTRNGGDASAESSTSGTSITFNGLSAGSYQFYFVTVCGDGASEYIVPESIVIN